MAERVRVQTKDNESGALELFLQGSADVAAVAGLRQKLVDLMPPQRDIVLHLEELEKLDGAGVQLVFAAKRTTERNDRTFTVVVGDGAARRAIETAGALKQLEGEETCQK